jgi:acetolactate synthase-1/2/3 large subunit
MVSGNTLFGQALKRQGVDTMFYIMGGPLMHALHAALGEGVRGIDVRHEQAAALAAQAYARLLARPGVCLGASGPGAINLTTGLANALVDCAPVVAFGGSSPVEAYQTGAFQEIDQIAVMRPVTKWAERVYDTARIPEYVDLAMRQSMAGKPGPVYLDLPADVLYREVDESGVYWPKRPEERIEMRPTAPAPLIARTIEELAAAKRPIVLSGSGILWSRASSALQAFVDATGIPFYTTPQGRGVIPEDHDCFFAAARSTAFRNADFVLVAGTRLNYVVGHGKPPRFSPDARFARIEIDQTELAGAERVDIPLHGDALAVLEQLTAEARGRIDRDTFADWRRQLGDIEATKAPETESQISTSQQPIHPLRLCKEVRDFIDRDTILCVDGQEILNFGRQTIPSWRPGHRLNSGPFGMMGVGMPFALGAKAAKPDHQVVCLHGDGSFGLNAMEVDTAVRHGLPVLVVISLNGGWTGDPEGWKPGRDLGYTRFDRMFEAIGCHGEFVERPEDIRPALDRAAAAVAGGRTAIVNVVTDYRATATMVAFTKFRT